MLIVIMIDIFLDKPQLVSKVFGDPIYVIPI